MNDAFRIIVIGAFVCAFASAIWYSIRKKRRTREKYVLDKKTLMIDSVAVTSLGSTLLWLIFSAMGFRIFVAGINSSEDELSIFAIVFGLILGIVPLIIVFKNIIRAKMVKNGKYVIVLDELVDKKYYVEIDSDTHNSYYELYFKDYFEIYGKIAKVNDANRYEIGEKFYLVFIKGGGVEVFSTKEYTLNPSDKDKLKTIDEIKDYM